MFFGQLAPFREEFFSGDPIGIEWGAKKYLDSRNINGISTIYTYIIYINSEKLASLFWVSVVSVRHC